MEIRPNAKTIEMISDAPERFRFKVIKNNIVLIMDDIPTNDTFALSNKNLKTVKSYRIHADKITLSFEHGNK